MSYETILAKVKEKMETVSNIGVVHDYERWTARHQKVVEFFKTTVNDEDKILGWEITRRITSEDWESLGRQLDIYIFSIKGYHGLKDDLGTEKTFQNLIEAVRTAFRADVNLGDTVQKHTFIQVETVEHRYVGDILSHYAELSLTVYEEI